MERTGVVYLLIVVLIVALALFRTYLERRSRWRRFFGFLAASEVCAIAALLGALIFFGCLQILLRNAFHRGIIWADPLMRHIVLWLGCLGGALATSRVRHISIDVLTRILPQRFQPVRNAVIHFAAAAASSVLGMAALKLVLDERQFGEKAFLGIDVWVLQSILPFAFFLVAYRSLLNVFLARESHPIDWDDAGPVG